MTEAEKQALADEIAVLAGWEKLQNGFMWQRKAFPHGISCHPFPVGCLTSIAKALPEGWEWDAVIFSDMGCWGNIQDRDGRVLDGGSPQPDEWTARALAAKAAFKSKESK